MITISLLNRKGGSGKSSTCFHGCYPPARMGLRVLVVDVDPQANLTQGLLGPEAARAIPPPATVAAILGGGSPMAEGLVLPTPVPGVSILPGSEALEDLNDPRPWAAGDRQFALRGALEDLAGSFDLALVDCPPHVQLCSWAALCASDAVVVPLQAEDFGSQGVAAIQSSIRLVRSMANPGLALAGYLITMFDRRLAVHQGYAEALRALYGPEVFAAVVPRAKDFVEAVAVRKPVGLYRSRSAAAGAVEAVVAEMLARVGWAMPTAPEEAAA